MDWVRRSGIDRISGQQNEHDEQRHQPCVLAAETSEAAQCGSGPAALRVRFPGLIGRWT